MVTSRRKDFAQDLVSQPSGALPQRRQAASRPGEQLPARCLKQRLVPNPLVSPSHFVHGHAFFGTFTLLTIFWTCFCLVHCGTLTLGATWTFAAGPVETTEVMLLPVNTIVGSKQSTSFEAHNKRFGPPEHTSKVKTMAAKAGTQLAWTRPPKQRDADSPFDFRTFWTFGGFFFGEAIE